MLNLKLGGLGTRKFEPSDSFADISHGHSHLIVLIGLDICSSNRLVSSVSCRN